MDTCIVDGCDRRIHIKTVSLCRPHYERGRADDVTCAVCGTACKQYRVNAVRGSKAACSNRCRTMLRHGVSFDTLRQAIIDRDSESVLAQIRAFSIEDANGCWLWAYAKTESGYGSLFLTLTTSVSVHRLALEFHLGAPLGSQQAHHICANRSCVNPQHLQLVTARENTAEMMKRNWYERRIRDLEARLAELSPEDPLLNEVSIGSHSHTELLE